MFQFIGSRRRKRRKGRKWFGGSDKNTTSLDKSPDKKPEEKDFFDAEDKESILCDVNDVSFPGFIYRADTQGEVKVTYDYRVVMPEFLYHKLFMYVKNTKEEISGMGLIECKDNVIFITDIFIVRQENSASNTKIDNEDLARYTQELIKLYDAGDKSKNPTNMKLWWHSHGNGSVHWSGTDDRTCEDYNNNSWLIAFVVNHDRELLCRMEVYYPVRLTIENMPVNIVSQGPYLEALEKKCRDEIKEKCFKKTYNYNRRRGFHNNDDDYWRNKYKDYKYEGNKPDKDKGGEVVETKVQEPSKDGDGKGTAVTIFKPDGSKERHIIKHGEGLSEHTLKKRTTPQDMADINVYADAYMENKPSHWMGDNVIDEYHITWKWDDQLKEYYPYYQDKCLSEDEYAFVVEALDSGIYVDAKNDLLGS